jgi:hypothetical protein
VVPPALIWSGPRYRRFLNDRSTWKMPPQTAMMPSRPRGRPSSALTPRDEPPDWIIPEYCPGSRHPYSVFNDPDRDYCVQIYHHRRTASFDHGDGHRLAAWIIFTGRSSAVHVEVAEQLLWAFLLGGIEVGAVEELIGGRKVDWRKRGKWVRRERRVVEVTQDSEGLDAPWT